LKRMTLSRTTAQHSDTQHNFVKKSDKFSKTIIKILCSVLLLKLFLNVIFPSVVQLKVEAPPVCLTKYFF
jgi:hypothetical protein